MVTFGRVLREAGLEVGAGPGRRRADARSTRSTSRRQDDVYWSLRTTLVTRFEEIDPFDRAFNAWFLRAPVLPPRPASRVAKPPRRGLAGTRRSDPRGGARRDDPDPLEIGWSAAEVLRRRDFAAMTPEEFAQARALMRELAVVRPRRRSRRLRPHTRGARRSTCDGWLAARWRPAASRSRAATAAARGLPPLVVLCDISGSMEAYTRALLLFMHAAVGAGRVEVFAFGTRLTRLTAALRTRDPEQALAAAAATVVDWASGTRIGASLKTFNDEWGRRGALARRGGRHRLRRLGAPGLPSSLRREMARLARTAYAVVWVSPLKGHVDYEPLSAGMLAALPYVDRFLPGHNIASLEELADSLAAIDRRHAA